MKALLMAFLLAGGLTASPLVKGGFKLQDARDGKAVTQASYAGRVQFVFFGFTHCRLTCPTGLHRMAQALELLGAEADGLAPLFITTDPARDSPALMKEYAAAFSPRIIPLVGSERAVQAAMKAFRLEAEKVEVVSEDEYQMDHPAIFFVMDRQGRFIETLPSRAAPEELAARLRSALAR
jgi:protein SCO1/2